MVSRNGVPDVASTVQSCLRVRLPAMLHLASRSPRRAELLARLGLDFGVIDLDLPEHQDAGEAASEYVRRVAREKAGAGLLRVVAVPGALVLGADTEVILDGDVFGKPADADDAAAMLRRLSGRTHEVITAVSVVSASREAQAVSTSLVTVAPLDDLFLLLVLLQPLFWCLLPLRDDLF